MKLLACYLAGNCEMFVDMSIKSIKDVVDEIVVVYDTSSKDNTKIKLDKWKDELKDKLTILEREYEHDPNIKNANSNARNFYLEYLKKNHNGDFVLVLDMDEVCDENIIILKGWIEKFDPNKNYIFSIRMIHFIQDIGHEDYTLDKHYVLNRFFNVTQDLYYPDGEHTVLRSNDETNIQWGNINGFTIYHFGHCRDIFTLRDRYINNLSKSEIHTKDYLYWWYLSHLNGTFMRRQLNIHKLPKIIKDEFMIDKEETYGDLE